MTLGAGFHHYRVMFLDLEAGQRGEEGGEAGWVAGDARREKEAAGTSRKLDCSLGGISGQVLARARSVSPVQVLVLSL